MLYARKVCLFYLCILLVINYDILSIPLSKKKKKNVIEYNEHIVCVNSFIKIITFLKLCYKFFSFCYLNLLLHLYNYIFNVKNNSCQLLI